MPHTLDHLITMHDLRYVALALVVCCVGSLLSMRLFSRLRRSSGARLRYWLFLTALLSGGTIWTTHFVAMLGFRPMVARSFDPTLTLLSLAIAVVMCGAGFLLAGTAKCGWRIEAGGAVVGLGIGAMHYTGMMALIVPGRLVWNSGLIVASLVFGIAFGAVATNRIARPITRFCKYGGAMALILAIGTMHFTGMSALAIVPDASIAVPAQAISDGILLFVVVAVMVLMMAIGSSTYMIDQHTTIEALDRYRHLALHDPLTGLANRNHLASRLREEVMAQRDSTARIAVLTFDLDRFKEVNDVHGHAAGDAVLKAIAERLSDLSRDSDFLARVGGDEFVALRPGLYTRAQATDFARAVLQACREKIEWSDNVLTVGASIGISLYPDDGSDAEALLGRADLALYRAKSLGRDRFCLFDPSMDEASRARSALTIELREAARRGELELYYQPQNDTQTRSVIGFEALLRWKHPERGMVSPVEFIPIAEETGLIHEIGEWVLRQACREAAGWATPYKIAVNVSAAQLSRNDLPALVHEILLETGMPASRLEIEITESGIIADQQHALHVIRGLKRLGVSVAMDDYGTGYSSLATLQNFPFDKIKIDRSFVDGVLTSSQSAAIVRATIILGSSLDIPVLAEGVETEDHIAFLAAEGCNELQGFFFGKPMSRDDLVPYIVTAEKALARPASPLAIAATRQEQRTKPRETEPLPATVRVA